MSEFDLPGPLDSHGPDIADLVCEDVQARKQVGIKTYGKPLRANNGRPALWDLYAELLDACHYARQKILEQEMLVERIEAEIADMERCHESAMTSGGGAVDPYLKGRIDGLRHALCMVRGNHPREEE